MRARDVGQLQATVDEQVGQILGLMTALLLSVLIALFGLVNTLSLSVFERTPRAGAPSAPSARPANRSAP